MRPLLLLFLMLAERSVGDSLETVPPGATVFVNGKAIGKADGRALVEDIDWSQEVIVALPGYQAKLVDVESAQEKIALRHYEHTTSTGLPMVGVPILDQEDSPVYIIQFAIWETRVRDFVEFAQHVQKNLEAFPSEAIRSETHPSYRKYYGIHGAGLDDSEDYPVAYTSREAEIAFCDWLTKRDRSKGLIESHQVYRLPSDLEWSAATLIEESRDPDLSPNARAKTSKKHPLLSIETYPAYPLGNLKGSESIGDEFSDVGSLDVADAFVGAAPVGQYAPNRLGIYDLLGNLYEECLDLHYDDSEVRSRMQIDDYITRGPGYDRFNPDVSVRYTWIGKECGFRIVLASDDVLPFGYHGERPTKPYTKMVESGPGE